MVVFDTVICRLESCRITQIRLIEGEKKGEEEEEEKTSYYLLKGTAEAAAAAANWEKQKKT